MWFYNYDMVFILDLVIIKYNLDKNSENDIKRSISNLI
jgi:hypothetical protein